jgi:excinuclease ABC subunit A
MKKNSLNIIHARENNLKELSLSIEHDSLTVITGLSGSGKSSLAFDTVYAEGQRRYIETFSPYTRQFLDKVKKPNVDLIENVRPAIAIQQRVRVTNSRSTVGSMTNINDYLKVVWAALSTPHCLVCNKPLITWTSDKLTKHLAHILAKKEASTFLLGVAQPLEKKKKLKEAELQRLLLLGFSRYFNPVTKTAELLEETADPILNQKGELVLVLDRMKSSAINQRRIREVVEQAFARPNPHLQVIEILEDGAQIESFRPYPICEEHGTKIERVRPALFSYNHPYGACPDCKGFGRVIKIDRELCITNENLSIKEHAIDCWKGNSAQMEYRDLVAFCKKEEISITEPWKTLSDEQKEKIFTTKTKDYWGVIPWFGWLEKKAYKMHVRVFLSRYRNQFVCPTCAGTRLRRDALAYRVAGKTLPEIWDWPLEELGTWIKELLEVSAKSESLSREVKEAVKAVLDRVSYLVDLGLPYLTLSRQARTLSGGETQRVNLAAALGSSLTSTHFVLDEPSVGLHPRDTKRLISAIKKLKSRGNSVLIVEHDLDCLESADQIIELGPKAGVEGGEVVFSGDYSNWKGIARQLPSFSSLPPATNSLTVNSATARNLKNVSFKIPLQRLVCLSGVSGSGKSTLVHEVIGKYYLERKLGKEPTCQVKSIVGLEQLSDISVIDQSPLSKTPRANIATYVGIWEKMRELLALTPAAEKRALTKSSFSFNVDGGRCPHCKGAGFIREDMQFLSDVFIPCDVCLGKRFQAPVLEVEYLGLNADQLLAMNVDKCLSVFAEIPQIASPAKMLSLLGLGHLSLGHPLSELSGGEAQRLKLVPYIEENSSNNTLLIFDEPTTGLHLFDVARLLKLFRLLIERGNSILCIEHNLEVLAHADWLIDLGPEGGESGGHILCEGRPKDLLENSANLSETITFLKEYSSVKEKIALKQVSAKKPAPVQERQAIKIVGAREHNLKNISLDIPLHSLVAFTGVSGSGKSTIAKDIVYAEGQRRYLDCLSPYARQYIKELKRPQVVSIDNIPPTICVYQHTFQPSALSTVGTMSEAYNFLRLLFAKTATQYCPEHPTQAIAPASALEIAEAIHQIDAEMIRILAPAVKNKKGLHKDVFERAIRSETSEVRVDGIFAKPSHFEKGLVKTRAHTIEYVTARFNPRRLTPDLIKEAVVQALSISGGTLLVHTGKEERVFSSERTCPICQTGFYKPDPEDLSFSSKRGACTKCLGTGVDKHGSVCPSCLGSRLKPAGQNLRLDGYNIGEISALKPLELREVLNKLNLPDNQKVLAQPIFRELFAKLETLITIGLEYLPLARDCATLSGGELQRLRLATAIGSPLSGVLYIFDEPSIGLHPNDNLPVIHAIKGLKEQGNSVIIIEHDPEMIRACEEVIDIGPGGGKTGGDVVFSGSIELFLKSNTTTAKALNSPDLIPAAKNYENIKYLTFSGSKNNVLGIKSRLPLQQIVTIAGVSGAGKSSLVHGIIAETLREGRAKGASFEWHGNVVSTEQPIAHILEIDQKPIGANSRSTPASYLGIWDEIRKLYAAMIEAKSRGWSQSFFSYNTGMGRCPDCKGLGSIKFEMNFLPDSSIECETCQGKRFSEDALTVLFQERNISEVLSLTFEQALPLFAAHRRIHQPIHHACELGLGYLSLGQSSTTLSGGEAQRIKLVSEISSPRKEHSLYIFDEPTVGLHKADVIRLQKVFRSLVNLGHSVLIIEHDSDIVRSSDFVVEIGPGPGEAGGKIIFSGSPQELTQSRTPWGIVLGKSLPRVRIVNA